MDYKSTETCLFIKVKLKMTTKLSFSIGEHWYKYEKLVCRKPFLSFSCISRLNWTIYAVVLFYFKTCCGVNNILYTIIWSNLSIVKLTSYEFVIKENIWKENIHSHFRSQRTKWFSFAYPLILKLLPKHTRVLFKPFASCWEENQKMYMFYSYTF